MRAVLALTLWMAGMGMAQAAEIRVLTAGAFKAVLTAIVPRFEQQTGHRILLENDTAGGVAQRIERGAAFDLAVLTPATIAPLLRDGKVAESTPIAAVGIGVAIKEGARAPDLSTAETFKAALLAARSVAIVDPAAGGSSGIYMSKLFETMGIAAAMTPKLVLVPGGLAADRVASGEAELAIQQVSELMGVRGVVVVGPLPAEVQSQTVYVAGLSPAAGEAGRALLATLTGPETQAVLREKGMTRP
ncbi:MAG: substrate-binding domain-containing protein [Acetobacteraceae bacterium]